MASCGGATPHLLRAPFVYRITLARDWECALRDGYVARSPLDAADGFYHFSCAAQVAGTLARFFAGASGLVLLQMRADSFATRTLRFEHAAAVPGPNNLFPHLYVDRLPVSAVSAVIDIALDSGGTHVLSVAPLPDRAPPLPVLEDAQFAHTMVYIPIVCNGESAWGLSESAKASLASAVAATARLGGRLDVVVDIVGGHVSDARSLSMVCEMCI